ncbi:MAG: hypothetical protein U9Q66_03795 [Patescibacteria group bacterium]|nr:hypothetical protein [Patescibacteria group bacterium]
MYRKINIVFIVLLFLLTMCSIDEEQKGVFVSTKNTSDTLILSDKGKYLRIVENNKSTKDKGTWYYENNRLWFNDWRNRDETEDVFCGDKTRLVAFSFDKSFSGKIKKIYFDVDNYYYYKRIK